MDEVRLSVDIEHRLNEFHLQVRFVAGSETLVLFGALLLGLVVSRRFSWNA